MPGAPFKYVHRQSFPEILAEGFTKPGRGCALASFLPKLNGSGLQVVRCILRPLANQACQGIF